MEGSQTQKTEIVSLNALYRGGKSLMQLQRGPEDAQTILIELEKLKTSRFQKRVVTPERVKQLAETIRNNGLLQPVTARQVGDELELIAGHRRREAFKLLYAEATTDEERAKWARIPCIIRMGLTDVQAAALSAVENLERDDGDPLEQGLSLLEVKRAGAFSSNTQVAEATGMNVQRVARLIRLAEAPELIQSAVTPGLWVDLLARDGTASRERRRLDLTVALVAIPFYRHHERVTGAPAAQARTERLLVRAAKGEWTRTRLEQEVKRAIGAGAQTDGDDPGTEQDQPAAPSPQPRPRKLLFRDRGDDWVLYPKNISSAASRDELSGLLERLRNFVGEVERAMAAVDGSNHQ